MIEQLELGLDTFGEITTPTVASCRMHRSSDQAVLADELGIDFFGVGERHRARLYVALGVSPRWQG
jgi:hypothetical protein